MSEQGIDSVNKNFFLNALKRAVSGIAYTAYGRVDYMVKVANDYSAVRIVIYDHIDVVVEQLNEPSIMTIDKVINIANVDFSYQPSISQAILDITNTLENDCYGKEQTNE